MKPQQKNYPQHDKLINIYDNVICIIAPFNNFVKFSKLNPNIIKSREYIEFLKAKPGSSNEFITDFVASFKRDGKNIIVERSDYGQLWITSIPIEKIKKI